MATMRLSTLKGERTSSPLVAQDNHPPTDKGGPQVSWSLLLRPWETGQEFFLGFLVHNNLSSPCFSVICAAIAWIFMTCVRIVWL